MKTITTWILSICLLLPITSWAASHPITLEFARTHEEMAHGLMERDNLPDNHGMLFIYPKPSFPSIWMYKVKINLAIAFLDEKGVIRQIVEMKAYPKVRDEQFFRNKAITASFPATYVLEMPEGWFKAHNVHTGDTLHWSPDSPNATIETGK